MPTTEPNVKPGCTTTVPARRFDEPGGPKWSEDQFGEEADTKQLEARVVRRVGVRWLVKILYDATFYTLEEAALTHSRVTCPKCWPTGQPTEPLDESVPAGPSLAPTDDELDSPCGSDDMPLALTVPRYQPPECSSDDEPLLRLADAVLTAEARTSLPLDTQPPVLTRRPRVAATRPEVLVAECYLGSNSSSSSPQALRPGIRPKLKNIIQVIRVETPPWAPLMAEAEVAVLVGEVVEVLEGAIVATPTCTTRPILPSPGMA